MYQSDLKSGEWAMIEDYFVPSDRRGCKPTHKKKAIVDAILYVVKSGCQWRMLPKDFLSWKTVYGHFNRRNKQGLWERVLNKLNGLYRERENRHAKPSYGIIDPQSVKRSLQNEPNEAIKVI